MKIKLSRHPRWTFVAYASVAMVSAGISAHLNAQSPQPPAVTVDQQNIVLEGTVDLYLMNPDGQVDGILLNSNTIVRFPPHLSEQLIKTVSPRDSVKIDGFTESTNTIHAGTITNLRTADSITDTPPGPGRLPPTPNLNRQRLSVSGTIRLVTHAPRGEPDGVVLTDGTIVHFPPLAGQDYSNLLQPGRPLAATGFGTVNSYGKSLEATTLACSGSQPQTVPTVAPPLQARP
ncbi:MAG: hypothetical protein JO025_12575 [Verrucomicrobia bacterium]|nr:hypothetical protein [Verrucomicrobiota bacterium]